ncbi:MAG: hypothetical protein EBY80_16460, partial [Actinobacteria bacterium]|nr:hypothetical protein [Actinomycetota bacterium]
MEISLAQAALGTQLMLPTLDGDEQLIVPAGTQFGREFVLKGRGVPRLSSGGRSRGRGDLRARIVIVTPTKLSGTEEELLRRYAEERKLTVQMGYMLRYNPGIQLLVRATKEGWFGDIMEIDASMGKLLDVATRKRFAQLPGGGMYELACHLVDTVVTLMGPPLAVQAFGNATRAPQDTFVDNQLAVLTYPKATVTIRCNHADPFGGPNRHLTVRGTKGDMEISPLESGTGLLRLDQHRDTIKVIADATARPRFIASDLLAQAEHDPLSQSVLLTPSKSLAEAVREAAEELLIGLSRREILDQSLQRSRIVVVSNLQEAFDISNRYAPEHLIIHIVEAREWLDRVTSAGSVFLGQWTPEPLGDYCSGTNHVLPTYGYARAYSGLSVLD